MPEPMNATRWGVRAVDTDSVRIYINGSLFDFDPRGAADLAETIRVILGIEKPAPTPGGAESAPESPAAAPKPVTAATDAHGGAGGAEDA